MEEFLIHNAALIAIVIIGVSIVGFLFNTWWYEVRIPDCALVRFLKRKNPV